MQILELDDIDFAEYEQDTEAQQKIIAAPDFVNDVLYELAPADDADKPKHAYLPFANCFVEFKPGEVTAWAGFNNSGKSVAQGQVLAGFALAGRKVCLASFEMKPKKTLARIVRQQVGISLPTRMQVSDTLKRLDHLWLYDQQGSIQTKRMLAIARYCGEVLGIEHLAIDSMMKCIPGTDNYNAQKDFIDALTHIAADSGMHIHVVVHLKKGDSDERLPTRYDISGSADISNLVDNVLLVWRNKKKEREREAGKEVDPAHPDALIICDKQRNGEWEGRIKLWYERDSMRYTDHIQIKRGLAKALT